MRTGRSERPWLSYIDGNLKICGKVTVIRGLSDLHKSSEAAFALASRNLTGRHHSHLQQRCSAIAPPVLGPVLGLQLKVSVALPDRSTAAKEMVRGLVVHVTFGVVKLEEGRITVV